MTLESKLCDKCNSEIIKVKQGRKVTYECSYCGEPYEKGTEFNGFIPEFGDEDE